MNAFLTIAGKACDAGDAIGCSAYGMTQLGEYRETPDPETLTKATAALTKACDLDALLPVTPLNTSPKNDPDPDAHHQGA